MSGLLLAFAEDSPSTVDTISRFLAVEEIDGALPDLNDETQIFSLEDLAISEVSQISRDLATGRLSRLEADEARAAWIEVSLSSLDGEV